MVEVYDELHECEPVQAYEYYWGTAENPISMVVARALVGAAVAVCPGGRPEGTGVYHKTWSYTDGLGRPRLTVTQAEAPHGYVASGWQEYSSRGAAVRSFEPFAMTTASFAAPPVSTPVTLAKLDALSRPMEVHPPQVGAATYSRTLYLPFETHVFDEGDSLEAEGDNPWCFPAVSRVDGQGRVVGITKHNDSVAGTCSGRLVLPWQVSYDALGNIAGIEDPQGNARAYSYDSLSRMTAVSDPNAGELSYVYDDAGNLLERMDAKGQVIRNTYGLANRLHATELLASAAAAPVATYTYHYDVPDERYPGAQNLVGRLAAIEGPLDGLYSSYDVLGRPVRSWRDLRETPSAAFDSYDMQLAYDPQGKVTDVFYPGDLHLAYHYNERQLLWRVRAEYLDEPEDALLVVRGIRYDESGAVLQQELGNWTSTWRSYDARHRLTALASGPTAGGALFQSLRYHLTATGLIERIEDQLQVSPNEPAPGVPSLGATYTYDRLYQLTSATTSRGTINYRYDTIQNLISRTTPDIPDLNLPLGTFGYGEDGAGPNQLTSAGGQHFRYDDAGQMQGYNGFALAFDPGGRLTRAQHVDGTRIESQYDFGGERLLKRVVLADGSEHLDRYVFDGYQERDGEPTWIVKLGGESKVVEIRETAALEPDLWTLDGLVGYVADPATFPQPAPVELLDADGDGDDAPDAQDLNEFLTRYAGNGTASEVVRVVRYYHPDHLGTPTHTTDSGRPGEPDPSGRLVSFVRHHPYGAESELFGEQPIYGFTGAEREPETALGLVRMGARWYAPRIGRWVSADPLFLQDAKKAVEKPLEGTSVYAYVGNNPVLFVDSSGTVRFVVIGYTKPAQVKAGEEHAARAHKDAVVIKATSLSSALQQMADKLKAMSSEERLEPLESVEWAAHGTDNVSPKRGEFDLGDKAVNKMEIDRLYSLDAKAVGAISTIRAHIQDTVQMDFLACNIGQNMDVAKALARDVFGGNVSVRGLKTEYRLYTTGRFTISHTNENVHSKAAQSDWTKPEMVPPLSSNEPEK